jgi:hypothetical protein
MNVAILDVVSEASARHRPAFAAVSRSVAQK